MIDPGINISRFLKAILYLSYLLKGSLRFQYRSRLIKMLELAYVSRYVTKIVPSTKWNPNSKISYSPNSDPQLRFPNPTLFGQNLTRWIDRLLNRNLIGERK